mgnify:CR=1 FL=1
MMQAALLALAALLAASPAQAQPQAREFTCIGAERMEDDVFSVPFARGSSAIGDQARSALAAAIEAVRLTPDRNLCVLGHAGQEGGATTTTRLAATRARTVAERLAAAGIEPDRIRAEARNATFSRRARQQETPGRSVTIVVMPGR